MADRPSPARASRAGVLRFASGLMLIAVVSAPGVLDAGSTECPRWRAAFASMPARTITVESEGRPISFPVKVAETDEQQAAGFQCSTATEIDRTLILFDFGHEVHSQFHMQNVPAPLDIAFAKDDGRIFAILRMEPSPTALYGPMEPFRWAVEARRGFYESQGIRPGRARLRIPAP
jgi:uncharacterized membrane protein (UPF0127 family)